MDFFTNPQFQVVLQLILAVVLGALIGLEREYNKKEAGMRTYSLVCLGSTLFTILGFMGFQMVKGTAGVSFDPSRVVQAVAVGIGFLGAGLIIFEKFHTRGLTSAAGLWLTAAVGVALGIQLYFIAIISSVLAIIVLAGFGAIENKLVGPKE